MGKHKKEVNCSGCKGDGGEWRTRDGKRYWQECVLCHGTGKQ